MQACEIVNFEKFSKWTSLHNGKHCSTLHCQRRLKCYTIARLLSLYIITWYQHLNQSSSVIIAKMVEHEKMERLKLSASCHQCFHFLLWWAECFPSNSNITDSLLNIFHTICLFISFTLDSYTHKPSLHRKVDYQPWSCLR